MNATTYSIGRAFRARLTEHPLEVVLRVVPTIAYIMLIFAVSAVPGQDLHAPANDKVIHFFEFAVLGVLLMFSIAGFVHRRITAVQASTAWFFGALYAFSDEFHQSLVPNRDASVFDWLADVCGLAVALLVVYYLATATERT